MSGSSDRSQRRMCASMPVLSDSRPLGDDRPSPRLPGRGCARSAVLQGVGLRHGRRPRAPLQPYYYTLDPASPSPWSVLGKLGPHRLVCTVGTAAWRSVLGLEKGTANAQCRHALGSAPGRQLFSKLRICRFGKHHQFLSTYCGTGNWPSRTGGLGNSTRELEPGTKTALPAATGQTSG